MENLFNLTGKTILVTGASSGIGKQTAIRCSEYGARVVITGRNEARLNETYSQLSGDENNQILCDLSTDKGPIELVEQLPILDGLMLCAGFSKTQLIKHTKSDYLRDVFNTNTFSNFSIIQYLLKQKKIVNGGSIVLVSSVASHRPYKGNAMYSASKGALNSFAKVLSIELAPQKIRVNCIEPGIIIDLNTWKEGAISVDQWKQENDRMPLGFGEPDDIAYATIYLLSDVSKWVTGSSMVVDGGQSLI